MDNAASVVASFVVVMVVLFFIGVWVYSIAWAAGDARRRGKSAFLVGLLVFFVNPWPLGLVLWLVFRPDRPVY